MLAMPLCGLSASASLRSRHVHDKHARQVAFEKIPGICKCVAGLVLCRGLAAFPLGVGTFMMRQRRADN